MSARSLEAIATALAWVFFILVLVVSGGWGFGQFSDVQYVVATVGAISAIYLLSY